MFTPGLVSISFRSHSVEEITQAAAAAGLKAIEWGSDVHAPCTDPAALQQAAQLTAQHGLTVSSYGTYFKIGEHAPSEILPYIRAAKGLGTQLLRLWCGTKGSGLYTAREQAQLFEDCRALAALAETAGVTLAMEYHPNTFTDAAAPALALMEAVNSPAFRLYWQPSQFRTAEENLAELRCLAPYVTSVHVFNWTQVGLPQLERRSLAEAVGVWKQYKALLPGDHAMLLEFMPDDRLTSLPKEAAALLKILED